METFPTTFRSIETCERFTDALDTFADATRRAAMLFHQDASGSSIDAADTEAEAARIELIAILDGLLAEAASRALQQANLARLMQLQGHSTYSHSVRSLADRPTYTGDR